VVQKIVEAEDRIVELIKSGMTLKGARQKAGYHALQTPEDQAEMFQNMMEMNDETK